MTPISPETRQFINEHQSDDVRNLALQARKYPDVDIPAAITQIAGRQIAAEKIPSWKEIDDIWYPKHLSLEQCSSEITARYKASLLQGESLADLTGGFGIDCSFLATGFRSATYVERQAELCTIAAHNFPALDLNHISVRNDDGVAYLEAMSPVDCIFLDPARRNEHGGKTVVDTDDKNIAENIKFLASCHGFKIRKNLLEQSQKYRKHDTGVNCFYTEFPATCNKTYDQQYDIQNHGDRRQWHRDKVGKHDSKT